MYSVREGKIPDSLIETIRDRADILSIVSQHLTLKKSGSNFSGLCPFHTEKTPSFVVNPAKQFFHCFGCAAGGDVFHFLSKVEQITFPEAVRRMAEKVGITIPSFKNAEKKTDGTASESELIYQMNEKAAERFHHNLMERKEAEQARRYLKERGISEETIQTFQMGYALPVWDDMAKYLPYPVTLLEKGGLIKRGEHGTHDTFRDRIILPIKTAQGRIVGFGGRVLSDVMPKYLNTSETPVFTKGKHLFGLDLSRGKTALIIVEGYFDLISLFQNGISNVVATMGTAITSDHIQSIRRYSKKVFLALDPDKAGVAAMVRSAPLFIDGGIEAAVIALPVGCDPDMFVRQQGATAFLERLGQAKPLIDFVITQTASVAQSIEEKAKEMQGLFPLIRKMDNKVEQGHYLKHIADTFGIEESDVRTDFSHGGDSKHPPLAGHDWNNDRPIGQNAAGLSAPLVFGADVRRGQERITLMRGTAPARGAAPTAPEDEKTLLALFIQDRLSPERLSPLHPDDFMTAGFKGLIAHIWNDESRSWYRPSLLDHLDELNEADRVLLTELAVLDIPTENQKRLEADCIDSLQTKRLRRETNKIQKELKSAEREGDLLRATSLQQAFFSLKKEINQIVSHQNR